MNPLRKQQYLTPSLTSLVPEVARSSSEVVGAAPEVGTTHKASMLLFSHSAVGQTRTHHTLYNFHIRHTRALRLWVHFTDNNPKTLKPHA